MNSPSYAKFGSIFAPLLLICAQKIFSTKEVLMSKDQNLSLETVYSKSLSLFKAVIMTSYEARFINEQANLGFIELTEKPTTIAIHKFKNNKLKLVKEEDKAEEEPPK